MKLNIWHVADIEYKKPHFRKNIKMGLEKKSQKKYGSFG
jgi:hypothetical protein